MTAILIIIAALTLWLIWELATAPFGFQDETGFHHGDVEDHHPQSLTRSPKIPSE